MLCVAVHSEDTLPSAAVARAGMIEKSALGPLISTVCSGFDQKHTNYPQL